MSLFFRLIVLGALVAHGCARGSTLDEDMNAGGTGPQATGGMAPGAGGALLGSGGGGLLPPSTGGQSSGAGGSLLGSGGVSAAGGASGPANCDFTVCPCANYTTNASEIPSCQKALDCYVTNACLPTDPCATTPEGTCGPNKIGGGTAPLTAAAAAYDCACGS